MSNIQVVSRLEELEAEFAALERPKINPIALARQRRKGLTAPERLGRLFDPGTFHHVFSLRGPRNDGDGVVTGWGRINGKKVYAYAWDFMALAGTCSLNNGQAIAEIIDTACKEGCPIIGLNDSGGARVQDGVASLIGFGLIFEAHIRASGRIVQISAILGPCAGGAVYAPALTDFIVMTRDAFMAVTGPAILKAVTGKTFTMDELGGVKIHSQQSGRVNYVANDDEAAIEWIRELLSFMPGSCTQLPPLQAGGSGSDPLDRQCELSREIMNHVTQSSSPFDVRMIIKDIVDGKDFFEISEVFARNLVTGFGRLGGWPIGIIANQSTHLGGSLDRDACKKAARFIRFCDCFNIPLITLVDVPGFTPSLGAEPDDIQGFIAELAMAYRVATVLKLSVVLRRAYGAAFTTMCSKTAHPNRTFAWLTAQFSLMDDAGAAHLINRGDFPDEGAVATIPLDEVAGLGFVDEVVRIRQTRPRLVETLLPLMEVERLKSRGFKGANWPG